MQPLGRQRYLDKTGGKHFVKVDGKTCSWWEHLIEPNKHKEKMEALGEVKKEIDNFLNDRY